MNFTRTKEVANKAAQMMASTRFFIIQETIACAFVACVLYSTVMPKFPITEFLVFLGPVALGAYGIRTLENLRGGNKNGNGNEEIPIR